jgi:hypothetical protein
MFTVTSSRPKTIWLSAALLSWTLAALTFTTIRLTFDRAPVVHVRWAASVDDRARAELEERFHLTGAEHDSGSTWRYFLTSPSPDNIEALVKSPAVEDTHHIDRLRFRVSPSATYRGPHISTTPDTHWVLQVLRTSIVVLVVAGIAAFGFALAPAVAHAGPPTWGAIVLGGTLLLIWTQYLLHLREGAEEFAPFRVGDWLVSYTTGFVRRGLPGSPILALTVWLDLPPQTVVLWIQAALYTVFSLLLLWLAWSKRLNIWFLAFVTSPAGLLFPVYDPAVAGRKDLLFLVAFALYAWWMPRPERGWTSVATLALGAATTLAHELFFFFTPYFFLMRLLQSRDDPTIRRFVPELSLFGGSLVALIFASTIGAEMHGEAQCAALLARGVNEQLCDGILRYPIITVPEAMDAVRNAISQFSYLPGYPIAAALAIAPLLPLFATMRVRLSRTLVLAILATFLFTLPMFVIALDWGRLLNLHVMALAIVIVTFLLDDRRATPGSMFGVGNRWLQVAILFGLCCYLSAWSVRHCCDKPLRAGLFELDETRGREWRRILRISEKRQPGK